MLTDKEVHYLVGWIKTMASGKNYVFNGSRHDIEMAVKCLSELNLLVSMEFLEDAEEPDEEA